MMDVKNDSTSVRRNAAASLMVTRFASGAGFDESSSAISSAAMDSVVVAAISSSAAALGAGESTPASDELEELGSTVFAAPSVASV